MLNSRRIIDYMMKFIVCMSICITMFEYSDTAGGDSIEFFSKHEEMTGRKSIIKTKPQLTF
jgi:hypothetical protein